MFVLKIQNVWQHKNITFKDFNRQHLIEQVKTFKYRVLETQSLLVGNLIWKTNVTVPIEHVTSVEETWGKHVEKRSVEIIQSDRKFVHIKILMVAIKYI
jgi:hypothetical protein